MKKPIIGVALIFVILSIFFNFDVCIKMMSAAKRHLTRETAHARVDMAMGKMQAEIASLDGKERQYTTEARKIELSLAREQKEIAKLKEAIAKLSATAKAAGLPKPSEIASLTSEQAATTLTFDDKRVTGREVYATIERWFIDLQKRTEKAKTKMETINRMRSTAEQMKLKKSEMTDELAKMEGRVKELEASKDLAKLNVELAEVEANVKGVNVGESGKALKIIEDEIDELNAQADTYQEEAQTKKTELNPDDVLIPSAEGLKKLDLLWQ